MESKISLRDFANQWKALLARQESYETHCQASSSCPPHNSVAAHESVHKDDGAMAQEQINDPFDCSDIMCLPLHLAATRVAQDFTQQWKDLDERKILGGTAAPSWYTKHVRLPDQFDYTTSKTEPPPEEPAPEADRVVSLEDPTIHLSYERALWDLFATVPISSELSTEDSHSLRRTEAIVNEIQQGMKDYTRMDAHALSRLRMKDRHGLPPAHPANNNKRRRALTVAFECWKGLPTRFGASEPNRMMIEMLASESTLLDLHQVIVDLYNDSLWLRQGVSVESSGMFLVEDTCYTSGPVDYAPSFLSWLMAKPENQSKLALLTTPKVASMESVTLDELKLRLGVRYIHLHHGSVECSVYLVDRKIVHLPQKAQSQVYSSDYQKRYPVLHDTWSPSFPLSVQCEACQQRTATIVTSTECVLTLGHRKLCSVCATELGILREHQEDLVTWKGIENKDQS